MLLHFIFRVIDYLVNSTRCLLVASMMKTSRSNVIDQMHSRCTYVYYDDTIFQGENLDIIFTISYLWMGDSLNDSMSWLFAGSLA